MGRPFFTELHELARTYEWAQNISIDALVASLADASPYSLVAVGSGGAYSAATYAAQLHEGTTGHLSCPMTPLEFRNRIQPKNQWATLFLSASGRNVDILNSIKSAGEMEPARMIAVCMRTGSKIAELSDKLSGLNLLEYDSPSGKDGFLATNSLVAKLIVLNRAYHQLYLYRTILPPNYSALLSTVNDLGDDPSERMSVYDRLWSVPHLIVLFGESTRAAAIDIESKFAEAALGTVQLADYRNFAHGRHHWLAKHPATSAVLALITSEEREIARRTIELLPSAVPVIRMDTHAQAPIAGIATLCESLYVVASAGRARGIDPGRPGVPSFGRKLYHLRGPRHKSTEPTPDDLGPIEAISIARKATRSAQRLSDTGELDDWREAYRSFHQRLRAARFGALILDYDGTILRRENRFGMPEPAIQERLIKIIESGVRLGIATGRGGSVLEAFRQFVPQDLWPLVIMGYHNGAEVAMLSESDVFDPTSIETDIEELQTMIQEDFRLRPLVESRKSSRQQLSLRTKNGANITRILDLVNEIVGGVAPGAFTVQCSSHSVDVLRAGISKINVLDAVERVGTLLRHL